MIILPTLIYLDSDFLIHFLEWQSYGQGMNVKLSSDYDIGFDGLKIYIWYNSWTYSYDYVLL